MNEMKKIGRREATRRALVVIGAATVAPSVLAGCGGEAELTCTSTAGLSADQIQLRQTQQYVDHSPNPDQKCEGCQFWTAPPSAGTCGGCQVLPGPIHPEGYCTLYAPRQA